MENNADIRSDERTEALEIRLAYLEDFIQQLNDVVIGQDTKIESLKKEIKRLESRMEEERQGHSMKADERPPHY